MRFTRLISTLAVALAAQSTICSPIGNYTGDADSSLSDSTNMTMPGVLGSGINIPLEYIPVSFPGIWREEMSSKWVCGKFYKFLYELWIVQAPPEWWYDEYRGDDKKACKDWEFGFRTKAGLHSKLLWKECWRMDKKYPSGDVNWLHIRFLVSVFFQNALFEAAIRDVRDPRGAEKRPTPAVHCEYAHKRHG
ncbi:hypothetical protein DL766_007442 [Monosporascus sp. MC13-8B]|uniref:Uncharacterized protein n=1 Tax=Monosporascus cannonballus TaxID=155416 RepID=A0ABY0HH62_9PEZI|nr:hypothetical protein DL762_002611 [Monosporascus cannonballus]RYP01571.1 hypothetical protein DL763_000102 [Monosporascus cannonballus]RYP23786.1 hypothetical protein DL766_007442 [Monosporascus sp. MC13-8B]